MTEEGKLSTSWKLTIFVYIFSVVVVIGEMFSPFPIDETKASMITNILVAMTGSTTAGGVFNSVYKHKAEIQQLVAELQAGIKKKPDEDN